MVFDFMDFEDIVGVVDDINYAIEDEDDRPGFINKLYIVSSSDYCSIKVDNTVLWNNCDEARDWIDDDNQESLLDCLTRRLDEYVLSVKVIHDACLKLKERK